MDNIFGPPVRGKHLKYRDSDIADYSAIRAEVENIINDNTDLDSLLIDMVSDEFLSYNTRTFVYTFATKLVATWWNMTRGRR